jgi:hypothetical protein
MLHLCSTILRNCCRTQTFLITRVTGLNPFAQSVFPASNAVGVTAYSVISKLLSQFLFTAHIALFIFLPVNFRLSYYVFSQRR